MTSRKTSLYRFFFILFLVFVCGLIAIPQEMRFPVIIPQLNISQEIQFIRPNLNLTPIGINYFNDFQLKQGLDIQGGTQVLLRADMSQIPAEDRVTALESAKEVIGRRVDLYGVSEPLIQTSQVNDEYRIVVELAGVDEPSQAIALIGTTAKLDFRIQDEVPSATASVSEFVASFQPTDLSGADLRRSTVQFDQQTGQPVVGLEFNEAGTQKFAELTKNNVGQVTGIFLDGFPLMLPRINQAILNGQAVITGDFSIEEAKALAIQLNAGALPVPIEVIEQRTIGASLGADSVRESIQAGLVGLGLVMLFMVMLYGWSGVIADLALMMYAIFTIAVYKFFGVTLTLPGIAGLLLSIGMAVDANILIFERMKEELRLGQSFERAMELGFGRAWDSIKDANFATIFTALVLINPMNFSFLNSSGLVRGFGITLLIGVLISLFTGVVVTRTLMRLFLKE